MAIKYVDFDFHKTRRPYGTPRPPSPKATKYLTGRELVNYFQRVYSILYDWDDNGTRFGSQVSYEIGKTAKYLDKNMRIYKPIIDLYVKTARDFISSDREAAAFVITIYHFGLLRESTNWDEGAFWLPKIFYSRSGLQGKITPRLIK